MTTAELPKEVVAKLGESLRNLEWAQSCSPTGPERDSEQWAQMRIAALWPDFLREFELLAEHPHSKPQGQGECDGSGEQVPEPARAAAYMAVRAVAKGRSHYAPEPDSVGLSQFARAAVDAALPYLSAGLNPGQTRRLENIATLIEAAPGGDQDAAKETAAFLRSLPRCQPQDQEGRELTSDDGKRLGEIATLIRQVTEGPDPYVDGHVAYLRRLSRSVLQDSGG